VNTDLFLKNPGPIILEFCDCERKNGIFRETIDRHHKYMKYKDTCNRRLNWLIFESQTGNLIGAIGINSAILALGARDKFIGWDRKLKSRNITMIANNYRFALIRENITIRNAGTQALKVMRKLGTVLWERRYGDKLILLESLVKPPWCGSVYKADNWIYIGDTKGFSFSKAPIASWKKESGKRGFMARNDTATSIKKYATGGVITKVTRTIPKLIFVKPLCDNWKDLLNDRGVAKAIDIAGERA